MTDAAYKNNRLNMLAAAAFLVVILCLAIIVFRTMADDYTKSIFTLILGRFLGYVDNIYNFEFGTTRGSKAKDDVINTLTAASPAAPPPTSRSKP